MIPENWIPERFARKNEVASIEVIVGDLPLYHLVILKKKKESIEIVSTHSEATFTELLSTLKDKKLPVVLILNGRGVINKLLTSEPKADNLDDAVAMALPGVNCGELAIQLFQQNRGHHILTFCRKEIVELHVQGFERAGIEVCNVLLGCGAAIGLNTLLKDKPSLRAGSYELRLEDGRITAINTANSDTYMETMGSEEVRSRAVLAFAGAFSYLASSIRFDCNFPSIKNHLLKHEEKNKLKFMLVSAIVIALFLSVVNAATFSYFFKKSSEAENLLAASQSKFDEIIRLSARYEKNKSVLARAALNKRLLTEYADRIAASVPDEVVLSEIIINPLIVRDDSWEKGPEFDFNRIIIRGACGKSHIVSEWATKLKTLNFVTTMNLEKYTFRNDPRVPNFEIKLSVK